MRLESRARPEFVAAFRELAARIASALDGVPEPLLPVQMFVAGGAALHFYTGERISHDIDAAFSKRIALPEDLEVAYRDADGAARMLYFDRQYSDTFALMHEDAYEDSIALPLDGIDAHTLEVRLLMPLDLAISKLSRFSEQDRNDIAALARRGLIDATSLRRRALDALSGYVGDILRVRGSIEFAGRVIEDIERRVR